MKRVMKKAIPLAAVLALGVAGTAGATSFSDIVSTNSVSSGASTRTFNMNLNGSSVISGAGLGWNDTNANGVFDGADTLVSSVHVFDRNGVQILASGPASIGWTPAQLNQWALDNAMVILQALVPAGLGEVTGASDDDMMANATVTRNLFTKTVVARKSQASGGQELNQDVRAQVEYLDLKVRDKSGSAYSMIMDYSNEAASGLNFSLTLPVRFTKVNDDFDSKSNFIGLDLALKYPVAKWEKSELSVGGDIFASAFYMKNNAIDKAGNLKYGAGLFTSVSTDLGFGTLGVGVDYKISKAKLPSSMNSDNTFLNAAVDYVNDLDPVHTISYGFNLGVPVAENAAANLEILRSSFVSSDVPTNQKNRTSVSLSGTYLVSDSFELNLGIRSDFELKDVDTLGVMIGATKSF